MCYPTRPCPCGKEGSSLALKVGARGEEGDALVHDGLAYPQVVFDPSLDARSIAELLWFNTDTVRPPDGRRAHVSRGCQTGRRCEARGESRRGGRGTYVRPVERRTPARKAETAVGVSQEAGEVLGVGECVPSTASKA